MLAEFTAAGSPTRVSRAIEEFARSHGVSALVVPWESDAAAVSIAVTSVKADGWAIEHTNLGTIRLTDLGNDATRIAIAPDEQRRAEAPQLGALFERFAQQVERRFGAAS